MITTFSKTIFLFLLLQGLVIPSLSVFAATNDIRVLKIEVRERYLDAHSYSQGAKKLKELDFSQTLNKTSFGIKDIFFTNEVKHFHHLEHILSLGSINHIVRVRTTLNIVFVNAEWKRTFISWLKNNKKMTFSFRYYSDNLTHDELTRSPIFLNNDIENKEKKLPIFSIKMIETYKNSKESLYHYTTEGELTIKMKDVRPESYYRARELANPQQYQESYYFYNL